MKSERGAVRKLILACVCGILFCDAVYYFVDHVLNGVFVDWFTESCMYEYYDIYEGKEVLVRGLFWPRIKSLLLVSLGAAVVILAVLVFAAFHFYAKAERRKAAMEISHEISMEIQDYMRQDRPEGEKQDPFKKEYAEVSAQMAEIKSTMQRHEQILKEEAARKNDLITYLAHDLRTPLTSVLGYLNLLSEVPDMPSEQKMKYVNIALDKAQRLEKLINEFFDITRYNLQQIELEEETIDLSYMLVQMTDEFYPLLSAHGNTINLQTEEGVTIHGDPVRLARVFSNILKNAIAYSYRDTAINVWTERAEKEVRIFFRNSGKTIPTRKLDSIFEKFFRLDEARTSDTGGAGLGLAIAKEIVALHGGTITASSEQEKTTFCVSLPAGEAERADALCTALA